MGSASSLFLLFEALLSLGQLVSLHEKQTGDILVDLVGTGTRAQIDLPLLELSPPGWFYLDRLVFIIGVEISVDLQESLQYGILDSLVDKDNALDVSVE